MSNERYAGAVRTARDYYNSNDADTFYFRVWGGEDIHVGLYADDDEPIADASRRTVERMCELLGPLGERDRVLDLGAGYGGSMRYLARRFGCRCVAFNLSEVENIRDREKNAEQGLDELIEVVEGDFTHLPFEDECFDVVWSQEAILHAGDRARVCAEVARVLVPGGRFVFTDPMQADDADPQWLRPIYERLHLDSLASPGFYRKTLKAAGLEEVAWEAHHEQLSRHYARVAEELEASEAQLRRGGVSDDYIGNMKAGLEHWVDGGRRGDLEWGIFVFRKPA